MGPGPVTHLWAGHYDITSPRVASEMHHVTRNHYSTRPKRAEANVAPHNNARRRATKGTTARSRRALQGVECRADIIQRRRRVCIAKMSSDMCAKQSDKPMQIAQGPRGASTCSASRMMLVAPKAILRVTSRPIEGIQNHRRGSTSRLASWC